MLVIWPIVTIGLFMRLPHRQAIVVSLLAGYLLLPVRTAFEIPVLVDIDKATVAAISAFVAACAFARGRSALIPRNALLLLLIVVFVISPAFTAMGNRDPMVYESRIVPGMSNYDTLSIIQGRVVTLIPFILGYAFLRDENGYRVLLATFVSAALLYSLPMFVEMRLSPQLNSWVYGFFPHSFAQQVRAGGYRPVVFLGHGLVVAIFISMAVVALAGLLRIRRRLFNFQTGLLFAYLAVVLLLCRSAGSLVIAFAFAPLGLLAPPRLVRQVALVIGVIALTYPVIRQSGVMQRTGLDGITSAFSSDRAASLNVRTENEDALLVKANQRPVFGWGSWGRNRIYQEGWGTDLSVTDGTWIMTLGSYGYVGYFAQFGLLCFGLLAYRPPGRAPPSIAIVTLMLVLCANLVDLVPNSSLSPLTWLLAGALCPGALSRRRRRSGAAVEEADVARAEPVLARAAQA